VSNEQPAEKKRNSPDWAVIVALVIVLGGVAYVLFYDLRWGRGGSKEATEHAQTYMLVLETSLACRNFKLEFEKYPWDTKDGAIDPEQVYAELCGRGTINRRIDYTKKLSASVENGKIVDIWGNALRFRIAPETKELVVWSCGPDGKAHTADDVSNRRGKTPASFTEWEKQIERSQEKGGTKVK